MRSSITLALASIGLVAAQGIIVTDIPSAVFAALSTTVVTANGAKVTLIDGTPGGPIIPGVTGNGGNALVTENNPQGVMFTARLPESTLTQIRGEVAAMASLDGKGVVFNINLSGFPDISQGPFIYHIHDQPVPADGNCTKTLAHLDPFIRGEAPPCDSIHPETCQVGDLAGKHGNITGSTLQQSYTDRFLSTQSGIGAFFGNRSLVIHDRTKKRLTCANFTMAAVNASMPTASASHPGGTAGATMTQIMISGNGSSAGPFTTTITYLPSTTGATVTQNTDGQSVATQSITGATPSSTVPTSDGSTAVSGALLAGLMALVAFML